MPFEHFGLPFHGPDGHNGKIRFEIREKIPWKNGSTCYMIHAREVIASDLPPTLIQIYRGFYNAHKDTFTLYPYRSVNVSFLGFPFSRFDVNPVFVRDLTIRPPMDVLTPDDDLEEYFS